MRRPSGGEGDENKSRLILKNELILENELIVEDGLILEDERDSPFPMGKANGGSFFVSVATGHSGGGVNTRPTICPTAWNA
jgi:hypothetical protein